MLAQQDNPAWTFFVSMCVFLPACWLGAILLQAFIASFL